MAKAFCRKPTTSRIGRSATTSLSPITTSSNTSQAFPARPATSRATCSPAAIRSRVRVRANTRRPPLKQGYAQELFTKAATGLGLHPFPRPSANISAAYTNPYGCSMAPCTYCGFCERFGCANYSKASPQTCVLPALVREPTFEARTGSEVTRVNLSKAGKTAPGVTYVDLNGEEWEQPADIVLVCAYSLFNVRLLLLSGIGKP